MSWHWLKLRLNSILNSDLDSSPTQITTTTQLRLGLVNYYSNPSFDSYSILGSNLDAYDLLEDRFMFMDDFANRL
jgi:hypothetical protein